MIVNRFYNWRIRNRFSCPGSDKYEKKKKQEKRWVNPSPCFSSDEISIINDHICAKFERSKMSANYEEIFCPFVVMVVVVCVVIRVLKNKLFAKKGKSFSIGRNVNDYNVLCYRNQSKPKLDLINLNQRYLYSSFVCKNWIKEDWSHMLSIGEFKRNRLNSVQRKKSNMFECVYLSFYLSILKIVCLISLIMNSVRFRRMYVMCFRRVIFFVYW